jgi:hypothetical protein
MTVKAIRGWAVALPLILSFGAGASAPARANPLSIERAPVTNAVAELDRAFDITIVVKGAVKPETPVSLSVDDRDAPGAVLDAVNQLSNDLGGTFQKSFVISKLPKSEPVPPVHVDSATEIYFSDNSVGAEDSVQRVADLDSAEANFVDPVSGTIFLSDVEFPLSDAANEIAKLTHTRWQAIYTITMGNAPNAPEGRVVDRTNEGQPILQLPFSVYEAPPSNPAPTPAADTKTGPGSKADAQAPTTASNTGANDQYNVYNPYSIGGYEFGNYTTPQLTGVTAPAAPGIYMLPGAAQGVNTVTTGPVYSYP